MRRAFPFIAIVVAVLAASLFTLAAIARSRAVEPDVAGGTEPDLAADVSQEVKP